MAWLRAQWVPSGCRALWEISRITNCDPPPLERVNQNQEGWYFGGTCSSKYVCMKGWREKERTSACVWNERVCVHPGPQDHSVAMVTSTIRTQEAKAWDLRESDGVRLRNEMSYVSVCASVCLSHGVLCCSKIETDCTWRGWGRIHTCFIMYTQTSFAFFRQSMQPFAFNEGFFLTLPKRKQPSVRVKKEPSLLPTPGCITKLPTASFLWHSLEIIGTLAIYICWCWRLRSC